MPHIPVLQSEILQAFENSTLHTFVDGTLGAGGHAHEILSAHSEIQQFIGIDQDKNALKIAQERLTSFHKKTQFILSNYEKIPEIIKKSGFRSVDGILLDIGVSSMQLDTPERGFSFMRDGPLDMRMSVDSPLTAADIVNERSEQELGKIFRDYGEEQQWRAAARTIVQARKQSPILTTHQLAEILRPLFSWKKKGINPLTLIFQALRIAVNRELEVLENVLPKLIDLLAPKGRLAVITFHSLEDRIVKNAFRYAASDKHSTSGIGGVFLNKDPIVTIITKRPIVPSEAEMVANPRSRSAKLRYVEKI